MTTIAMNGLWAYIQTLNLSKRNRQWLADKLIGVDKVHDETEYLCSSPAMVEILKQGMMEVEQDKGESVNVDELWK